MVPMAAKIFCVRGYAASRQHLNYDGRSSSIGAAELRHTAGITVRGSQRGRFTQSQGNAGKGRNGQKNFSED
jgi:hypothetical protein